MPKTAHDLTPKQWRAYHPDRMFKILQEGEHFHRDKQMENAVELSQNASELLKQKFGAPKMVLFGSLLHKSRFTPWADIDLAVWGISIENFVDFLKILSYCYFILSNWPTSILGDCPMHEILKMCKRIF